jgi:hypothetical protein
MNKLIGIEILTLAAMIKDEEFSLQGYYDYLVHRIDTIGLFGAFNDDGKLVGIVHFERPGRLYPERGHIVLAAIERGVPHKVSKELHSSGEAWVQDQGATYVWGYTKRSPRATRRLYGYRLVKEHQMLKGLSGDTYKNIELQE